jgi:hypothetical protein
VQRDQPGRVDLELIGRLRPEQSPVLELILPLAFCPAEVDGSPDRRWLGVAVTGFSIAPASAGARERAVLGRVAAWLRRPRKRSIRATPPASAG